MDDYGKTLYYTAVVEGLRQLNPGIHADMAGSLGLWHPRIGTHAGLYFEGHHISAIDRDAIPEYKIWSLVERDIEIPAEDVYKTPGARTIFREVLPGDPQYEIGLEMAKKYDGGYALEQDRFGDPQLRHYRGFVKGKVKGKVIKVGWRHTFEAVIHRNIAHLTRDAIGKKFGVDMHRFLVGLPPEQIHAALVEV